jgi:ribosome maturation factor RimP
MVDFDDNKGNIVLFEEFDNDLDEDIDDEDQAFDDDDDEEMIVNWVDKNGGIVNSLSADDDMTEESDDNDIDDSDDSVPVIDIEPIRVENMNTKWCQDIEKVFISTAQKHNMYITKLRWFATRVEIVLSTTSDNNPDSVQPSADVLTKIHQEIYNELDAREEELQFISRYELLVATPGTHLYTHSFIHNHSINHLHLLAQLGIGEYLTTDRDFITFKGFPVTVTTSEEYKKKINFDGNVIGRDDTHVILSLKGRLIKIPRGIVASVKLPKSQHESTDYEMQKLK